jgi:hypothetical protein
VLRCPRTHGGRDSCPRTVGAHRRLFHGRPRTGRGSGMFGLGVRPLSRTRIRICRPAAWEVVTLAWRPERAGRPRVRGGGFRVLAAVRRCRGLAGVSCSVTVPGMAVERGGQDGHGHRRQRPDRRAHPPCRLGMPGGSVGNGESAYADCRVLCGVFGGCGGLSGCGSGGSARPGLARRAAHPAMSGCGSAEG